jgi:predicted regulator of Ras-like GTPase activity (Roadblock/LC7/MglB family)
MNTILSKLNKTSASIEASAIISNYGVVISESSNAQRNDNLIGTMISSMLLLGDFTSQTFDRGALEYILIQCSMNDVVLIRASEDVLLAVVLEPKTHVVPIVTEIKHTCKKITARLALLEQPASSLY